MVRTTDSRLPTTDSRLLYSHHQSSAPIQTPSLLARVVELRTFLAIAHDLDSRRIDSALGQITVDDRSAALAADLGVDAVDRPIAADLLVNCTSVGLADGNFKDLPIDADALGTYATVADLVYRAGGTELIAAASSRGCAVVDGLEVLVRQGALSFQVWTGLEAPIDVMRDSARGAFPGPHDPGTSDSPDRRAADPRRPGR